MCDRRHALYRHFTLRKIPEKHRIHLHRAWAWNHTKCGPHCTYPISNNVTLYLSVSCGHECRNWVVTYYLAPYYFLQQNHSKTANIFDMYMSYRPFISYDLGHRKAHASHKFVTSRRGHWPFTDTCIMYHLTNFNASRNVILHMRYVSTCVGARVVGGLGKQWTKAITR
jgi:hypothetical protein